MALDKKFIKKMFNVFNRYIETELKKPFPWKSDVPIIKNKKYKAGKFQLTVVKKIHMNKFCDQKFNLNKHLRIVKKQKI